MRLEMPLQKAHPKATVRNQPLKRRKVTKDHLPKPSRGSVHGTKALLHRQEFLDSRQRRKNLAGLGIEGHAEILRSLRGHKIRLLLVYHNPEGVTKREEQLDGLLGFPLRRSEKQPVVQIAEKSDPVGVCPRWHGCEDRGEDLGSGRQSETQGSELVNRPLRLEPQ